jgi:hypothetical protein
MTPPELKAKIEARRDQARVSALGNEAAASWHWGRVAAYESVLAWIEEDGGGRTESREDERNA